MIATASYALGFAASTAPCDILAAAGTPCVAAHSMARALYATTPMGAPLYTVYREDDRLSTKTITVNSKGMADTDAQDAFCNGQWGHCIVLKIFDQSPNGNDLELAPPGGAAHHPDKGVNASAAPSTLNGHKVYGARFTGGMGYRRENTTNIATGDEPESMYMVVNGTHYNDGCCFDYGNAETDAIDHGKGTMEAIYWGSSKGWQHGHGDTGPWVMADLENGLWAGHDKVQESNVPIVADFVTAMAKGKAGTFALKGGDAQQGALTTLFEGPRPPQYETMKKQGAIILGIGGDNSDWAVGTWFEGIMAKGYTTDATDNAVQASIVAAGFGK